MSNFWCREDMREHTGRHRDVLWPSVLFGDQRLEVVVAVGNPTFQGRWKLPWTAEG